MIYAIMNWGFKQEEDNKKVEWSKKVGEECE